MLSQSYKEARVSLGFSVHESVRVIQYKPITCNMSIRPGAENLILLQWQKIIFTVKKYKSITESETRDNLVNGALLHERYMKNSLTRIKLNKMLHLLGEINLRKDFLAFGVMVNDLYLNSTFLVF